ncbi:MAG: hypothetical protein RLZZ367_646 [Bacteroidota bacterium]|jgi:hypothetical protein
MAQFRIPPQFIEGFRQLSMLSSEQSGQVGTVISTLHVGASEQFLAGEISKKVQIPIGVSSSIARSLFSIASLKSTNPGISETINHDISTALKTSIPSNSKIVISEEMQEQLEANLDVILKNDASLLLTLKATALLYEYDKVFVEARIISDIRLVYNNEITNNAKNALVVHQLRIMYNESGEQRNVIIALDGGDLESLKSAIVRAEEKEKQIRSGLYTNSLEIIDYSKG